MHSCKIHNRTTHSKFGHKLETFKTNLKSHLFILAFDWSVFELYVCLLVFFCIALRFEHLSKVDIAYIFIIIIIIIIIIGQQMAENWGGGGGG